jgi:hypothetical protein
VLFSETFAMRRILFALALLIPAATAHAELPASMKVGDATLALNGAGTRTKYFMSMYEAGLYLGAKNADAAAIVASNDPMVIRLEIVSGMVTQEKMVTALNEGFAAATDNNTDSLRTEIEQFRKCFAAPIAKGDVFDLVHQPGRGVVVLKNGKPQGVIPGITFKQTVFAIWLGKEPADEDLKVAMLGK